MGWLSDPEERDYSEFETEPSCMLCAGKLPEGEPEWIHKGHSYCSWQCWNAAIAAEIWESHLRLWRAGWFFRRNVHYAVGVSAALYPWDHDGLIAACASAAEGRLRMVLDAREAA